MMSLVNVMEVHGTDNDSLSDHHTNAHFAPRGAVFKPESYRHWAIEIPQPSIMSSPPDVSFPRKLTLSPVLSDEAAMNTVKSLSVGRPNQVLTFCNQADTPFMGSKMTLEPSIHTCVDQLQSPEGPRPIPFSRRLFLLLVAKFWTHSQWINLWQSTSGSIFIPRIDTGDPNGIILQTPRDSRPFISLCLFDTNPAPSSETVASGIFVSSSDDTFQFLLEGQPYPNFARTSYRAQDLFILPILILETGTKTTSESIEFIGKSLQKIEEEISSAKGIIGLYLIQKLQHLAKQYLELDGRCEFEYNLAGELLKCFDCLGDQRMDRRTDRRHDYESASVGRVETAHKVAASSAEKLKGLLDKIKRLKDDFRDTNTYILADAAQRDGASMKTIAVLTLLFLPATAIASIFSMSMFNWQAGSGENVASPKLWIYFAVAVPLTAVVLSLWLVWYFWRLRFKMAAADFLHAVNRILGHDDPRERRDGASNELVPLTSHGMDIEGSG